ncbi:MAG: phosphoglucomutase/phosphomannomutase family protein [Meiothermus sp.]|uniref:phosphoglucomutase/phosphomannomutase family protein n=1 Tax=Meiothermus sp. TaxID=1955249 RepID=UPI0025D50FAC|nr:phosphoglucomutase/phosphomannomutase family protein [Meiothermus sp.]MCS7069539.1 phosphoglucomutase/phosphomannomutase family protein [Meiothermus sp.]MCX7601601.1 phosphoglucomutase/phosphomannomutase family protein [Meiothermus sp.]MDW8426070.1 phosphoglucomutase/phosphomannomutase family protein [Meiothermus sp.]
MADEIASNQSRLGIQFGTDGWRAIIGDQFTFANVGRVAQAYAEYLREQQGKKVVVGYDTRFMAGRFARTAAEVLAANGLEVHLSKSYLPTPALSFAVKHLEADGGVMITASHNPAEYLGFKIKGPYAGSATPALVAEVEKRLGSEPKTSGGTLHSFDVRKAYYDFLASQLDMETLRAYQGVMYHDSLGGAGAGWLAGFVKHAGLKLELRELHAVPDPLFYGVHPEPIPQNQFTIMTVLKAEQDPTFAVVNDGDADRVGAVLAGGRHFNSHQIFAVLLKHLHHKGCTGRVVKTFSTSVVVDKLARKLGLELVVTPIGFKYITDEMLKGGVLIGGEESGGIGVAGHIPERDGLLNALLLLESVARTGKSLGQQFAEIEAEVGFKHAYNRIDLRLPSMEHIQAAMARVQTPQSLAGHQVSGTEQLDGIKWLFGESGWLLFRPSGTEPVLRIYCEAPDDPTVNAILAEARKLVGA